MTNPQVHMRTQVLTVRDIMKYAVADHMGARVELEELATKALRYSIADGYTLDDLNEEVRAGPYRTFQLLSTTVAHWRG